MPTRTFSPYKLWPRAPKRSSFMSLYLVSFTLLCVTRPFSGETLRDLLLFYKMPAVSYTEKQLSTSVQGTGQVADGRAVIIYSELNGDTFVGPLQGIEYDFARKATHTSRLHFEQGDICMGSPEEVYLIDGYTLFSTHINPSAECLLLLDDKLAIRNHFFGFFPVSIARGRVAIIEDMLHFAPVHPERMEVIDLDTGGTMEIYPPANDPLRKQLSLEHKKGMPSPDICMRMNDPCDPSIFDEDFSPVGTDGRSHLAFVVSQSASHALSENAERKTVAEQSVLYNYAFEKGQWHYCEEQVEQITADALQIALRDHFEAEVVRHCKPETPVSPDRSTAAFNPFRNQ